MQRLALRRVELADGEVLYRWRTDPATRAASHNTAEIGFDEHAAWLIDLLADPTRAAYIAEHNGSAVGTVRADFRDGVCELSWAVAPEARGRGFGAEMVALLAASIPGAIRAEVKVGNTASIRIAESAGMRLAAEHDGILHFMRDPLHPGRPAPLNPNGAAGN